jgi:hypothetical protein
MRSAALTSDLHLPTGAHVQTSKIFKKTQTRACPHPVCTAALLGMLFCLGEAATAQTLTPALPVHQMPTEMTGSSRQHVAPPRIEVPLSENAWDFNRSHDIPGFGPMTAHQSEEVLRNINR